MRAPFQVLIFLFRQEGTNEPETALFHRKDESYWQALSGGGEGKETPKQAALRELYEEAHIHAHPQNLQKLSSCSTIPVTQIRGFLWGPDVLVIPEYCFAYHMNMEQSIGLSEEHSHHGWFAFSEARDLLHWESNKSALWELGHRLEHNQWLSE